MCRQFKDRERSLNVFEICRQIEVFTYSQDKLLLCGYNMVLYMSFDNFLLAVESRDLSQADKNIIRVSSFPKAVFE